MVTGVLRLSQRTLASVSQVGALPGSGTAGVGVSGSDATGTGAKSSRGIAVAGRGSWGEGGTPSLMGTAASTAGRTAGGITGRTTAFCTGDTGGVFVTGAKGEVVVGIPGLVTAVGATATDIRGDVLASAGVATGVAVASNANGRLPFRIVREPGPTAGLVSLALAGEISGATTAAGAIAEIGLATDASGTVTRADWLISATGCAAGGTGAFSPDKTGGAVTFGSAALGVAAIEPESTTAGVARGTGKGASLSGTGSAGTGTAASVAKLASGTTFTSPEIKSFSCRSEL